MNQGDKPPSRYVVINDSTGDSRASNPEAVRRVEVADEDRMAFRVGVNLLVLAIIGVAGYLLWRNLLG